MNLSSSSLSIASSVAAASAAGGAGAAAPIAPAAAVPARIPMAARQRRRQQTAASATSPCSLSKKDLDALHATLVKAIRDRRALATIVVLVSYCRPPSALLLHTLDAIPLPSSRKKNGSSNNNDYTCAVGYTPLLHACAMRRPACRVEIIQYLLETCPESLMRVGRPDVMGPLHRACCYKKPSLPIVQLLTRTFANLQQQILLPPQQQQEQLNNNHNNYHHHEDLSSVCPSENDSIIHPPNDKNHHGSSKGSRSSTGYCNNYSLQSISNGWTPLHCACHYEASEPVIHYLIREQPVSCLLYNHDADNHGRLPIDFAEQMNLSEVSVLEPMIECMKEGALTLAEACLHGPQIRLPWQVVAHVAEIFTDYLEVVRLATAVTTITTTKSTTKKNHSAATLVTRLTIQDSDLLDLELVRTLISHSSVKTCLQQPHYQRLLNGLLKMNMARRKQFIRHEKQNVELGFSVLESVLRDNLDALYLFWRDYPEFLDLLRKTKSMKVAPPPTSAASSTTESSFPEPSSATELYLQRQHDKNPFNDVSLLDDDVDETAGCKDVKITNGEKDSEGGGGDDAPSEHSQAREKDFVIDEEGEEDGEDNVLSEVDLKTGDKDTDSKSDINKNDSESNNNSGSKTNITTTPEDDKKDEEEDEDDDESEDEEEDLSVADTNDLDLGEEDLNTVDG